MSNETKKPITVATDGLDARVSKVEGVLARIGSMESFIADAQALADRMTIVERLVAAHVPVPAKVNVRSDAASTNEAMTEAAASVADVVAHDTAAKVSADVYNGYVATVKAAASDEGWREMLVVSRNGLVYDHTHGWFLANGKWSCSMCPDKLPKTILPDDETRRQIATCPPPPNLAEWWKPGAKVSRPDEALVMSVEAHRATCDKLRELHAFVKSLLPRVCECCRESIKAALGKADIPDDVLKL